MKREDLRRVIFPGSKTYPVSDADLAALGYVKLDVGRGAIERATYMIENMVQGLGPDTRDRIRPAVDALRQVLAALDGEET